MKLKTIRNILLILGASIVLVVASLWCALSYSRLQIDESVTRIYIDADDTTDSVRIKFGNPWCWQLFLLSGYTVHTGCYEVKQGEYLLPALHRIQRGMQTPVRLVIPSVRTMDQLAEVLAKQTMLERDSLREAFTDTVFCSSLGFTPSTLPAFFLPNTYEVYWNITLSQFKQRMQREYNNFWTEERKRQAQAVGLTPTEVGILASILDEETQVSEEKPRMAGMYLNRLRMGMPLQADPTVKFACGDFTLRRILHTHLQVESPYNTYKYKGLPPGPIRIPTLRSIQAVLSAEKNTYLYMCAKEDFSGSHRFATSYAEHLRNAKQYTKALNKRKIWN